jgi:hypothetical protein
MKQYDREFEDWTQGRITLDAVAKLTPETFGGLQLGQQQRVFNYVAYMSSLTRQLKRDFGTIHKAQMKTLRQSLKEVRRRRLIATTPNEAKEFETAAQDFARHWLERR